jgi:hypothetical protein
MSARRIVIAAALILTASVAAKAATLTYYRACCTDDPDRHGCGISGWYESEEEANAAGARHAQKTSGHAWTVESVTR